MHAKLYYLNNRRKSINKMMKTITEKNIKRRKNKKNDEDLPPIQVPDLTI